MFDAVRRCSVGISVLPLNLWVEADFIILDRDRILNNRIGGVTVLKLVKPVEPKR